jgi:hypothetical protein
MFISRSNRGRRLGRIWGVSAVIAWLLCTALATADEPQAFRVLGERIQAGRNIFRLQVDDLLTGSKRSWGPEQVEGPPDVAAAGTSPQAWASLTADGQVEWLVCEYENPVEARAVIVHESALPGALSKISAYNSEGDEIVAWEGDDPTPRGKPRGVSVIPVKLGFPISRVRVTIDSRAVPGWNEIDAIGLEDANGKIAWAKHVEASSTYAMPRNFGTGNSKSPYSPAQAIGPPNAGGPGDRAMAWCPATEGGQPEWLECSYKTAQNPKEIVVHENLSPGGITKIGVFDKEGREVTAWEGVDPTPRNEQWGVSVFPINMKFPFRKLKLYLNATDSAGYHEIDAVGLRDEDGQTQWAAEAEASSYWNGPQAARISPRMMPAMPAPDKNVRELQQEVKTLRKELEELRGQLKELKEPRKE